jgi:hypothetical protein
VSRAGGFIQAIIYISGVSAILAGIALAIRQLMVKQGLIVQAWIVRHLRRHTSLGLARALVMRECGDRLLRRDEMRFLVVPGQDAQIALPILTAFVPLRLAQDSNTAHGSDLVISGGPSRMIVIGEPGSGKSSLLKRELTRLSFDLILRRPDAKFPVFLRLSMVAQQVAAQPDGDTPSILAMVREEAASHAPDELAHIWDDLMADGRLVVLLDGLDEVPVEHIETVSSMVVQLCVDLDALGAGSAVVVSSRPQAMRFVPRGLTDAMPTQLIVERFSTSDIYDFLVRWPFHGRGAGRTANAASVFEAIGANPHLKQLCQTPLLLAMYCALISRSADPHDLPSRRSEFYERVLHELLRRRQRSDDPPSAVRVERWHGLAEEIAYLHLLETNESRNQVSKSTIDRALASFAGVHNVDAEFFRDFVVATGLLREERVEETYYFMHLSFAEFLAARRIARAEGEDPVQVICSSSEMLGGIADASIRAVILFVAPMVSRDTCRRLLSCQVLVEDHLTVLRGYAEAGDYDAPLFRKEIEWAFEEIDRQDRFEGRLETLLAVSDIWQQMRPAVEAGDLDGALDLSSSLEEVFVQVSSDERADLLGLISRTDEYTAWAVVRDLGLRVSDYPDAFVHLMAIPAFLDEYLTATGNDDDHALRLLVLLESALASRRVSEVLWDRPRSNLVAVSSTASRRLSSVLYPYERDRVLCLLAEQAPALTRAVSATGFDAPRSRELAAVVDRVKRWRVWLLRVPIAFPCLVLLVVVTFTGARYEVLETGSAPWFATGTFYACAVVLLTVGQLAALRLQRGRRLARRLIRTVLNSTGQMESEAVPERRPVGLSRVTMALVPRSAGLRVVRSAYPGLYEMVGASNRLPSSLVTADAAGELPAGR